jgi:predicted metal-dependent phosphoesterase TrpH
MNKNKVRINLHLHTYWSDGWHSPKKIVKEAKKRGFFAVAITDHNEIRGSLKATKYGERLGVIVFPAVELYFSVEGQLFELIALFNESEDLKAFFQAFRYVNDFIPSFHSIEEVTALIKQFNGVVMAPHPYGRKGIYRKQKGNLIPNIHIETINAFTGKMRNRKAMRNCKDSVHHEFGSADLHFFLSALSHSYTEAVSAQPLSRIALWENLRGVQSGINFIPKGKSYSPHIITLQKIMCSVKMVEYIPRQYFEYLLRKGKINKGV